MKRVLAACALAACLPVQATLNDIPGANYSFDDVSRLYWLDLTETLGQSYKAVRSGDLLDMGWRYATKDEVAGLFGSGESPYQLGQTLGWTARATSGPPMIWEAMGIYKDGPSLGLGSIRVATCQACVDVSVDASLPFGTPAGFPKKSGYTYASSSGFSGGVGSFLVSPTAPVPEPGTAALLGGGLLALWISKRRHSRS